MRINEFLLERIQSLNENLVDINLSDSGVHPYELRDLLSAREIEEMCATELGYGWTNGSEPLRDAIAALYPGRDRNQVIATNGSAEANFVMVMALLQPGDELIVVVPNYLQILGWAQAAGVVTRLVPLRQENQWIPDLAEIERAITPRTRMITLCNPNNPTGALLETQAMESLVQLARKHGLYLHADEIYKGSQLQGTEGPSFADLYEKALVTNGLSKAMAMPGLRMGWLVGPKDEIARVWHCKDYTSITTGSLSEFIACRVLEPARRAKVLTRSKHILRDNLAIITAWIERHSPLLSFIPPRAGGMAFIRYRMPINSTELVRRLVQEKSIFPVPGDAFGLDHYLRIGIGSPASHLNEGLRRLDEFFAENGFGS
ncbi:MAG: aminotransferase class I/II-fold pyridoxal phosphate-dependent enzyme [Proteobacteria bacterium]|nr:aminotransferase class I/II-fold pyridoxal phosphate-dependent enzyme [Pseudomonadota bacterium]